MEKKYEAYMKNATYSDNGFWQVIKKVGSELAEKALISYYVMKDPATPSKSKMIIVGALAYLILPVDLIPDSIPVVGFADDLAVIAKAMLEIHGSIDETHREKARKKCQEMGLL